MRKYNHSLDFTVLALAHAVDGDYQTAGKLLLKASKAHDVKAAVAILEASNAQAFAAQKGRVAASKRVKASTAGKTKVRAFDIGDEDDIQDLIEDEEASVRAEFEDEDEDEDELNAAEDDDEEEDDGDFDKAFASVLNGMKRRARK
jgi:hypothetical protein